MTNSNDTSHHATKPTAFPDVVPENAVISSRANHNPLVDPTYSGMITPKRPVLAAHRRAVALDWAAAEWPVVPIRPGKVKGRHAKGLEPTTDPVTIREWWHQWPHANTGLVLNGLRVVVLDADGHAGERSLDRLVTESGVSLPDTYEVATGRADGGRHLYYRLPLDVPPLANQYGTQHSWHADLDVLFQGHVVAAGSRHRSGKFYRAMAAETPSPRDLPALPGPLYELLLSRGKARDAGRQGSDDILSRPQQPEPSPAPNARSASSGPPLALSRRIRRMLADTSDGRNGRAFRVVLGLVRLGWDDDSIIAVLLDAPLGDKAREMSPRNPRGWAQQKIGWARYYQRHRDPTFDAVAYWQAFHTAGLSSPLLRVLDGMLAAVNPYGEVSMSGDRIGIASALSNPKDHLHTLVRMGWLVILDTPPPGSGLPRTYRLTLPPGHEPPIPLVPTPSPSFTFFSPQSLYGRFLPGHDAFRRAKGSLHLDYPVLTLLGAESLPQETLAVLAQIDRASVTRSLDRLVEAGIITVDRDGVRLHAPHVERALRQVAVQCGTRGMRMKALHRYNEKCRQWREQRAEWLQQRRTVGSPTWWVEESRALRRVFSGPDCGVRRLWEQSGQTLDDLVESVMHSLAQEHMDSQRRLRRRLSRTEAASTSPPSRAAEAECRGAATEPGARPPPRG